MNTEESYDQVADEYVRRIADELEHKPLDRELLDRFAASVRDVGTVCDMGCGPGHVARYLHSQGVQVCGVDLSAELVERARQLNPHIGDQTIHLDEWWGQKVCLDFFFFTLAEMSEFLLWQVSRLRRLSSVSRIPRSSTRVAGVTFSPGDPTLFDRQSYPVGSTAITAD